MLGGMKIRFTRHANDKFEVLTRHGWNILRSQVENTAQNPVYLDLSEIHCALRNLLLTKHMCFG